VGPGYAIILPGSVNVIPALGRVTVQSPSAWVSINYALHAPKVIAWDA